MAARARALKAEGRRILSFAAGEPDFDTPEAVCDAAVEAMRNGMTKYAPTAGIPELREAAAAEISDLCGLDVSPKEVVVSTGAKQSLSNALMTLLEPGDETIILAPHWPSYPDMIRLASGEPISVASDAESGFQPDLDKVREAVSSRTRAILINSPCNPTGAVFPQETMEGLAQIAKDADAFLISDEIYGRLVYGVKHVSPASVSSDAAERTILVYGCSKTYSMTGWRIGFARAPKEIADAMIAVQDQVTSCATAFSQSGAVQALKMPRAEVDAMANEFRDRRDLMADRLSAMPGCSLSVPHGAFYLLPHFGGDDEALAEEILDKTGVVAVPGSHFGAPGCLRFSYAASQEQITKGMDLLEEFFRSR